jgi:integrase
MTNSAFKIDYLDLPSISCLEDAKDIVITKNLDGSSRSLFSSDEWDFKGVIDSGLYTRHIIGWGHLENSTANSIKLALYKIMKHKQRLSISSIRSYKTALTTIQEALGNGNWEDLGKDNVYRRVCEKIKKQKLSNGSVERIAGTLDLLWRLGVTTKNIGQHKKFINQLSRNNMVRQAIALPEPMMVKVYNKAIDYIEKYHPIRYEINEANKNYHEIRIEYVKANKNTDYFIKYLNANYIKSDELLSRVFDLDRSDNHRRRLISSIQEACIIVLCSFSGCRIGEVVSFTKDNYTEIKYKDITVPLLKGLNTKNQLGGIAKEVVYPTHPIAKKALELAYDCTNYFRKEYYKKIELMTDENTKLVLLKEAQSTFISEHIFSKKNRIIATHFESKIIKFCESYNIRATAKDVEEFNILNPSWKGKLVTGGSLPTLRPHDFRRTFAVFLRRNKLGDILTLRYATKHTNLYMTAYYSNNSDLAALNDFELDDELMNMINEANQEMFANELFHIFNKAETLSGGEGERILQERKLANNNIYLSYKEILEQLKQGKISMVELETGFCIKADCDRHCYKPDCSNKIVTYEKALQQVEKRDRLIKKFIEFNNGLFYRRAILQSIALQIEFIENTLESHFIDFEPFFNSTSSKIIKA